MSSPTLHCTFQEDVAPKAPRLTLTVDTTHRYQQVLGFGGSGCWLSHVAEGLDWEVLDSYLRRLYGPEGIGLNSYRYNIGGGSPVNHRPAYDYNKDAPGLEVEPGVYDLSRDALGIRILKRVVELGVRQVVLFVNSPPARLTKSGFTTGMPDGSSNLPPENYPAFGQYVADITELLLNEGIPVTYVSPINEPQWKWGEQHVQEGCHYEVDEVLPCARAVVAALEERGLPVKVSLNESAQWMDEAYTQHLYGELLRDPYLMAHVDHFAVHSYEATAERRRPVAAVLQRHNQETGRSLPLYQSEWCSGTTGLEGAVELARMIQEDLTILHTVAWDFWVFMMTDDYSFFKRHGKTDEIETAKRFYAYANYTRFVTGSTLVDSHLTGGSDKVCASAYVHARGERVIVVVNGEDTPQTLVLAGMTGRAVRYETAADTDCTRLADVDVSCPLVLPPQSVTTLLLDAATTEDEGETE